MRLCLIMWVSYKKRTATPVTVSAILLLLFLLSQQLFKSLYSLFDLLCGHFRFLLLLAAKVK